MDFTVKVYKKLLESLLNAGFSFKTFEEYLKEKEFLNERKIVVLRHDVDALPENSLRFAQIQSELGIHGTYYFRVVPESWNEEMITTISAMGHEVGYHYENMDTVRTKLNACFPTETGESYVRQNQIYKAPPSGYSYENLLDFAYVDFCENLERFRKLVPVTTICAHGSPHSNYDNKAIWGKYNYKTLDIFGEPYYDIDFDDFFYLTDTGRRWNGWGVSLRDKVPQQAEWIKHGLVFHSTQDIINGIKAGKTTNGTTMPENILFTFHPQRWHNRTGPWLMELALQNAKNIVKYILVNS